MFCTNCGTQLNEDAKFCHRCGAPVITPQATAQNHDPARFQTPPQFQTQPQFQAQPQFQTPPLSPAFSQYLDRISMGLNQKPEYVPELNCYQFYCERFSAALAKMKQYIFITENDAMDFQGAQAYSQACMRRALNIYKGLPRGLQTGVVAYNVICQSHANPSACQFIQQLPDKHMAAFEMPIIMELSSKNLFYCTKLPVWGLAMVKGIRKNAEKLLRV
ncbi:MAG TPA: zinc ribbon domain-containing protein [Candidatus Scybalocola faecavium]|nr:zinc ribbon domain-containing protein [Candidatus Scybalocola faecavium]